MLVLPLRLRATFNRNSYQHTMWIFWFFLNFFLLLEEKRDFKPPEISETCWEVVPLFQEEHCLLHSRKCISEETEESGSFQKYSSSTKKMEKCLPKRASCSVKDTARLKRRFVSMVTEFGVRTSPASDIAKSKTQLLLFMQRAGFLTLPCPNKQLIRVLLSNLLCTASFCKWIRKKQEGRAKCEKPYLAILVIRNSSSFQ